MILKKLHFEELHFDALFQKKILQRLERIPKSSVESDSIRLQDSSTASCCSVGRRGEKPAPMEQDQKASVGQGGWVLAGVVGQRLTTFPSDVGENAVRSGTASKSPYCVDSNRSPRSLP